tara:strand:- start:3810 stop:4178 length:369 start_codon:yes stop_codon:yes gene_type:complete
MATVNVVTEDKVIVVDGEARKAEYTFPSNLWAIQWNGSAGHAEWTDGPNTDLVAADVDQYISMWTANPPEAEVALTAQEIINMDSYNYLGDTDWYVTRYVETGVAIPADVTTARSNARASIA